VGNQNEPVGPLSETPAPGYRMRVGSGVRAVVASLAKVIFHVIARECDEFTVYSAGTVVVTGRSGGHVVARFRADNRALPRVRVWNDVRDGFDLIARLAALIPRCRELTIVPDVAAVGELGMRARFPTGGGESSPA
jgi:hypothetical protein